LISQQELNRVHHRPRHLRRSAWATNNAPYRRRPPTFVRRVEAQRGYKVGFQVVHSINLLELSTVHNGWLIATPLSLGCCAFCLSTLCLAQSHFAPVSALPRRPSPIHDGEWQGHPEKREPEPPRRAIPQQEGAARIDEKHLKGGVSSAAAFQRETGAFVNHIGRSRDDTCREQDRERRPPSTNGDASSYSPEMAFFIG